MSRVAVPSIEADLANYAAVTHEAMSVYLPDTEPRQYLWDLVGEYPRRDGKAIRPALCLATAVAFGAELDEALPSAVALELLHNAFLVHDDIQDASRLRRRTQGYRDRRAPSYVGLIEILSVPRG